MLLIMTNTQKLEALRNLYFEEVGIIQVMGFGLIGKMLAKQWDVGVAY